MKTLEKHLTMGKHCLVLRGFQGERRYKRGEIVDTTNWRTKDNLVSQRYLRELPISYRPPKNNQEPEENIVELETSILDEVTDGVDP